MKKENQKKLLQEIMKADEKNGIYDSKPYFAKYLPVEGEIVDPDHVLFKVNGNWGKTCRFDDLLGSPIQSVKQAKLFLCSRDAPEQYNNPHVDYWDGIPEDKRFRVIGEILTENIQEGQEFTKDEIKNLTII